MDLKEYIESRKKVKECHLLTKCTFQGPDRVLEYRDDTKMSLVQDWDINEFKLHYAEYDMVGLKADHLGRLYVDYGQGKRCNHVDKIRVSEEYIGGEEENVHWVCAYCGVRFDEV